jgi:hypothetical protein
MPNGKAEVLRIVIIEDEMLVAVGLAYMVRELGHIVIPISTGLIQATALVKSAENVLVKPMEFSSWKARQIT